MANEKEFESLAVKVKPLIAQMRKGEKKELSSSEEEMIKKYFDLRQTMPFKGRRIGRTLPTDEVKGLLNGVALTYGYVGKLNGHIRVVLREQIMKDFEASKKARKNVLSWNESLKLAREENKKHLEAVSEKKKAVREAKKAKREKKQEKAEAERGEKQRKREAVREQKKKEQLETIAKREKALAEKKAAIKS